MDANTLVVLVSGEQLVGKSTLIKTLRKEGNNGTSNDSKRTRGIQMSNFTDERGQHLRIKDLAGQDAFSATHDIFCLSTSVPSLGLAVVNSKWDEKLITTSLTTTVGRFLSRKPPSVTSGQCDILSNAFCEILFVSVDPYVGMNCSRHGNSVD